jgi:hypothetical protein
MHRSTQISLPINPDWIKAKTIPQIVDGGLLANWKAGSIVAIDTNGYLTLAANMAAHPLGFLVTDALQGFLENVPGVGSGLLPVAVFDHIEVITDRVVDITVPINAGSLLTVIGGKVAPSAADYDAIGIALEKATVADPVVHGLFFHSGWPTA